MDVLPLLPRSPRRPVLRDLRLVALLAEFCRLQLRGRVVTESIGGEEDIRLQIWRDGTEIAVELLWCGPTDPPPATLKAVRIQGEQRQVWCTPGAADGAAGTVRFVSDLVLCEEAVLRRRYLLLG